MQPKILAPSILSANLACLGEDVSAVVKAGVDWIHFDVMDNHYVPNLTFGPDVCKALRNFGINVPIDVHLMVKPVNEIIPRFAASGADSISFHPDATDNIEETIKLIKDNKCKVGVVLNPDESLDLLPTLEDKIDMLLLMSVYPGFGGQKFIPEVLDKVRAARKIIDSWNNNIRLQIDGGVTQDNIKQISDAGADTFVAGSAVFNNPASEYSRVVQKLKDAIQ